MRINHFFRSAPGRIFLAITLPVLFPLAEGYAQFYNGSQMDFGKNRVQYSNFQWTSFRFDAFETYFYLNGKELAAFTANYAREQIAEMEDRMEVNLSEKIQFIIYNSLSDLKQSNIGLVSEDHYNTGGITHIIGRKVFLYFDGSHKNFERQIRHGIANVLINEMLYGGSLTSQVSNSTLLVLPDWYLNGLVSFLAEEWSTELDNRVRDGILSGRYDKFNRLDGEEARYAGHSLWKYINDEHGAGTIPDIVYMAKVSKNVESGFLFVLGMSFKNLVNAWLDHFWRGYDEFRVRGFSDNQQLILQARRPEQRISQANLSPDGTLLAYTTNELGKMGVWVRDLNSGKRRKIFGAGHKLDEKVDYSYPILEWRPDGKVLTFLTEGQGKIYLNYYTVKDRKLDRIPFYRFEKIVDFSYSHDARLFILSAVQKGQSDLYIYNIASRTIDQITNDIYDDLHPRFLNNSRQIIFSSNRESDTLRWDRHPDYHPTPENHDLFLYDYAARKPVLRRLTRSPEADELFPLEHERGYFTYLSDANGVYNRYTGHFDSTISRVDTTIHYRYFTSALAVTDYHRNIEGYHLSLDGSKVAEIVFVDGRYRLNLLDLDLAGEGIQDALPLTAYRQDKIRRIEQLAADSLVELERLPLRRLSFRTVREGDPEPGSEPEGVDIRDYSFDRQSFVNLRMEDPKQSANATGSGIPTAPMMPKQLNYYVEYSINELVSQVDFAFLNSNYQAFTGTGQPIYLNPGLNALLKVGAMDLLEDYRITGGVRLSASLTNNEYLLSFANLRSRLDKEVIFHRQVIEEEAYDPIYALVRHQLHEIHYVLKWPFSTVAAVRGSAILRNDRAVFLSLGESSLREPSDMRYWGGIKGEYIFDATRSPGMNLYYGLRYKIFGEYYRKVEGTSGDLAVLGFDLRHYTRIHRTMIWANRIATSTSFGSNKLIYYLGGVDNWLFPRFTDTQVDRSQNYAYQTLGTNMRGFDQNIRNGNSFFLINSEVRLPVFRYFLNRPIRSDFFNNFQVVGFGDLGTAWTGWDPYSKDNALFTRIIEDGPISVVLEEQKDPLVGGFGFGLRSRVLGYFLRADWAWGVEDRRVGDSVFYLSLSLDF